MTLSRRLRELIIRTSPWPPLRWIYAAAYAGALAWLVVRLRRTREIRSLEVRWPGRGHCFGSSDLDLRAQTVPLRLPEFFAFAEPLADVLLPGRTWRRIFDLYAFPAAEYELHARLGWQSKRTDRRWIRLIGRQSPPQEPIREPDDACLGRALLEYSWIGHYLFESPLDLHHTRILYARVVRVDAELREQLRGAVYAPPAFAQTVGACARAQALRGRVRLMPFDALAQAHALALEQTSAIARLVRDRATAAAMPDLTLVAPAVPDTLDAAVGACREAVVDLCRSRGGTIRSAILGATPGTRYEHRIYFVVRDDLDVAEHVALCRALRQLFIGDNARISSAFFRVRSPVVVSTALWRALGRSSHALRSVEEYYFLVRHGVVLCGEDSRAALEAPLRSAVMRSAAIAVADLRNRIWGALHHRQPAQLADLLAGRIPALWLLLTHGSVATTASEAVEACIELGFPHTAVLADLNARLAGRHRRELPSVDDAAWRPALGVLDDWLDDLIARAHTVVTDASR